MRISLGGGGGLDIALLLRCLKLPLPFACAQRGGQEFMKLRPNPPKMENPRSVPVKRLRGTNLPGYPGVTSGNVTNSGANSRKGIQFRLKGVPCSLSRSSHRRRELGKKRRLGGRIAG